MPRQNRETHAPKYTTSRAAATVPRTASGRGTFPPASRTIASTPARRNLISPTPQHLRRAGDVPPPPTHTTTRSTPHPPIQHQIPHHRRARKIIHLPKPVLRENARPNIRTHPRLARHHRRQLRIQLPQPIAQVVERDVVRVPHPGQRQLGDLLRIPHIHYLVPRQVGVRLQQGRPARPGRFGPQTPPCARDPSPIQTAAHRPGQARPAGAPCPGST